MGCWDQQRSLSIHKVLLLFAWLVKAVSAKHIFHSNYTIYLSFLAGGSQAVAGDQVCIAWHNTLPLFSSFATYVLFLIFTSL